MTTAVILKVWNEEDFIELCLNQFVGSGIDTLYLFDDGSTDDTIKIALSLSLPYSLQVIQVSEPHAEYFPDNPKESESVLLNRMIDTASKHDWIIHIDADEVFTKQAIEAIKTLDSINELYNGICVPYYHVVDSIDRFIVSMPGCSYQLHPDYHMRIYRANAFRFPEVDGLDVIIKPVDRSSPIYWGVDKGIIHLHYLNHKRRGMRGGTNTIETGEKQGCFRTDGCIYGQIPDIFIPDNLVDWNRTVNVKW